MSIKRTADLRGWPRGSHSAQPMRRSFGCFLICATLLFPSQSSAMSKYGLGPRSCKLPSTTAAGKSYQPIQRLISLADDTSISTSAALGGAT